MMTSERSFKGANDSSTHHLEPPSGDMIKDEFRTVKGTLSVPEGPGLGVEIDEGKLDHYNKMYLSGKYVPEPSLGRKQMNLWH